MADVEVPYGDNATDTAVLLLEAAQRLGLEPSVVRTSSKGSAFFVPEEVSKVAFEPEEKPVKAAAKKVAAKKAPAKKTAKKQEN